jgi:hypothetical protein
MANMTFKVDDGIYNNKSFSELTSKGQALFWMIQVLAVKQEGVLLIEIERVAKESVLFHIQALASAGMVEINGDWIKPTGYLVKRELRTEYLKEYRAKKKGTQAQQITKACNVISIQAANITQNQPAAHVEQAKPQVQVKAPIQVKQSQPVFDDDCPFDDWGADYPDTPDEEPSQEPAPQSNQVATLAKISQPSTQLVAAEPVYTPVTRIENTKLAKITRPSKNAWIDEIKPQMISDGLSAELAQEFIDHRIKKKEELTLRAWQAVIREAALAEWSLNDAITVVLESGWKSFKAEWVAGKTKLGVKPEAPKNKGFDPFAPLPAGWYKDSFGKLKQRKSGVAL